MTPQLPASGPARRSSRRTLLLALLAVVVACSLGVLFWRRRLDHSPEQPFCRVEEGLYLGSSVNQPPPGTNAVVNLCGRRDPYSVQAFLWEPIFEGGPEPDLAWLGRVVGFIAAQRQAGRTTYVHCMAGMNRSAAVVAAYLMEEHGWSRDQALGVLKKERPIIQVNPSLMQLLADWEQAHAKKSPSRQ